MVQGVLLSGGEDGHERFCDNYWVLFCLMLQNPIKNDIEFFVFAMHLAWPQATFSHRQSCPLGWHGQILIKNRTAVINLRHHIVVLELPFQASLCMFQEAQMQTQITKKTEKYTDSTYALRFYNEGSFLVYCVVSLYECYVQCNQTLLYLHHSLCAWN
jgi:hypothetical protein